MIDPKYDTMLADMERLISARSDHVEECKEIVRQVFADDHNSFKDLTGNVGAYVFQLMVCTNLILERATREQLPLEFMQHLVEALPGYFIGWSAAKAAGEAAAHLQRSNDAPAQQEAQSPAVVDEWPDADDDIIIH